MSAKFAMKLVIDDLTSPLLFARLSAVDSPRERAAMLRTIAESACRGAVVESRPARVDGALDRVVRGGSDDVTSNERDSRPVAVVDLEGRVRGPEPLPTDDGHDTSAIAEQFSAFY